MENSLQQIEQVSAILQNLQPSNMPVELTVPGQEPAAMDYLIRQTDALNKLNDVIQAAITNAQREVMDRRNLMDQKSNSQVQGAAPASPTTGNAPITAKRQMFNLSKLAQAKNDVEAGPILEEPELPPVDSSMANANQLELTTASDLKNWLDSQDRISSEQFLMSLVPEPHKEVIRSAMQDYFEGGLSEEQKLEVAVRLWPVLPDIVKVNQPQQEEIMSASPIQANKNIDKIVKQANDNIQKLAQQDSQKTRKTNVFNLQKIEKIAQHKSMDNVIMWGPNQIQVDEFTRQPASEWSLIERNKGFGLVLDDVWNVDWEAIWRGTIMDKYNRPYRDKDGRWVGGYIEKRFEVDKWQPEENQLQLKPGQLRRPIVAEHGVIEARLEEMRKKEAGKRNYQPDSSGLTYDWNKANSDKPVKTSSKVFNLKKASGSKAEIPFSRNAQVSGAIVNDEVELKSPFDLSFSVVSSMTDEEAAQLVKLYNERQFHPAIALVTKYQPQIQGMGYSEQVNFLKYLVDVFAKSLELQNQSIGMANISASKKKIEPVKTAKTAKIAQLAPYTSPFDRNQVPRRPKGSVYFEGKKKELKPQYQCRVCAAQMPSPSNGKLPTMCSCGKYPWSEVAVLVPAKVSPDKPGQQNTGTFVQPGMAVAGTHECLCKKSQMAQNQQQLSEDEKARIKKKMPQVELSDCGIEECKTDEFKMMGMPPEPLNVEEIEVEQMRPDYFANDEKDINDADNNIGPLEPDDIENTANDLEIDG